MVSFFKFLFREFISYQNYLIAFFIGLVINYFQGSGMFSSAAPYFVPILVQVFSKAFVKYSNRDLTLLVKLPAERKDPAFVINKIGNIITCKGKTKNSFKENGIKTIFDIFNNEQHDKISQFINFQTDTDSVDLFSDVFTKWYNIHIKADKNSDFALVWFYDITLSNQSKNSLRSKALFAELNPEPVFRCNKHAKIIDANPTAKSEFCKHTIIGKNVISLIPEFSTIDFEDYIKNDKIANITAKCNNRTYRFLIRGISEFQFCQVYGSDITEKIEAEEKVRSMALFAELNPEPVLRFNERGKLLLANPAAIETFQLDIDSEINVKNLFRELNEIDFHSLIKNNKVFILESNFKECFYHLNIRGISKLGMAQMYSSDITERVKAENTIQQQQKDITSSIRYAERIHKAVLPSEEILEQNFSEHFIFYLPRDVVSGDFYWFREQNRKVIIVVADSTGHGVPGAFMSMLGISFLQEIINQNNYKDAADILNLLRNVIKSTLSLSNPENHIGDGMDISLVIYDKKTHIIDFAGAYNHLLLYKNGELNIIKADLMPVGYHFEDDKPFTNNRLQLRKGDTFYLLSDGYVDQFGGDKNKKFSPKQFKNMLNNIQTESLNTQHNIIKNAYFNWKKDYKQIDDVLVLGVRC